MTEDYGLQIKYLALRSREMKYNNSSISNVVPKIFMTLISILMVSLSPGSAAIIWNETTNGDLSGNGASPTVLNFVPGQNEISGSIGNMGTVDRDIFTFIIPVNEVLTSIVLSNFNNMGSVGTGSFCAIAAGSSIIINDSSNHLGNTLISSTDVGSNIMPKLEQLQFGGLGFSSPLGAGTYTFWLQETSPNSLINYTLDFNTVPVPEPGTASSVLLGITIFAMGYRCRLKLLRKQHSC